jgi:signal peptidase I
MEEGSTRTQEPAQLQQILAESSPGKHDYLEYVKVILVTILVALFLKTFVVEAYQIPSGSMENTLLVGDYLIVNKLAYGFRTPTHVPFTNLAMPSLTMPLFNRVHRGDVVVFEYPGSYNEIKPPSPVNYVKRCIGLPGDTVRILHGDVVVNGATVDLPARAKPVDENELFNSWKRVTPFPPGSSYTQFDYGPIVVPKRGDTVSLDTNSLSSWKIFIEREGHSVSTDEAGHILVDGTTTDRYVVMRDYYFMLGDNRDNSLDSRFWGFVPEDNLVGEALLVYWSRDSDTSARSVMANSSSIRWNRIGMIIR